MPFLFQLVVGIGMQILGAILRAHEHKPKTLQDIRQPTADAGRPIPVVFGSVQITDPNYLYFGQVFHNERKAKDSTSGGK